MKNKNKRIKNSVKAIIIKDNKIIGIEKTESKLYFLFSIIYDKNSNLKNYCFFYKLQYIAKQ